MKKILYIDMDGVLCDYAARHLEFRKQDPKIAYPQAVYGFFANLDPIEGAIESFKKLSEVYDTYILTAPSYYNPLCYTEKRVWVEKHLGLAVCKKLIISPNKALLKGDFLIDDIIHAGFEGEHLHFGQEKFPNWEKVVQFLL